MGRRADKMLAMRPYALVSLLLRCAVHCATSEPETPLQPTPSERCCSPADLLTGRPPTSTRARWLRVERQSERAAAFHVGATCCCVALPSDEQPIGAECCLPCPGQLQADGKRAADQLLRFLLSSQSRRHRARLRKSAVDDRI